MIVFWTLLSVGLLLCLPLYRFRVAVFLRSNLLLKIILWIPIFFVYVLALYLDAKGLFGLLLLLLLVTFKEYAMVIRHRPKQAWAGIYIILFSFALLHFSLLERSFRPDFTYLFIIIGIASVLSDVFAFFMGNYAGKHSLPAWLNGQKSWEGVLGQFLGAGAGVLIVSSFIFHVTAPLIFLAIGAGSSIGDLGNSYIKRRLNIKDWSKALPGHGGFLDRLSSLAGAALFAYYFLLLSR
jgi:phosphatidate cytidylyltransferase